MTAEELGAIRREVARLLGPGLQRIVETYNAVVERAGKSIEEPVVFGRYQTAAKAALAHLEALAKLGRWALAEDGEAEGLSADEIDIMVRSARAAVGSMPGDMDDTAQSEGRDDG